MSLHIPAVPNFSDNEKDLPIGEMEKLIKEITDKRNYDVEVINRNISHNNSDNNADKWLKPQETSIKSEKFQQPIQNQPQNQPQNQFMCQIVKVIYITIVLPQNKHNKPILYCSKKNLFLNSIQTQMRQQ